MGKGIFHNRHIGKTFTISTCSVINLILALASALRILFERYKLLFTCRPEKQEVGKLVRFGAIGTVDSKLESPAKVLKELLVGGTVVVTHGLKLGRDLLFNAPGNGF